MVRSLKREEPDKEEKEPGKFAKMKKTLIEGLRKYGKGAGGGVTVVAALGMLAGCGDTANYVPNIPDGQTDGTVDGSVDGDKDLDAGVDGDVDVDGAVDAGPDASVDGDVDVDGGDVTDAGVDGDVDQDAGVDGDVDVVEPCVGVTNETEENLDFPRNEDVLVGGYQLRYVSARNGMINVDIRCAETGADVAMDQQFRVRAETTVDIPQDGKRLSITVHFRDAWGARCTVVIEDL